ncbi:unnamed protein product, partial [Strongylus vulgaris]
PNKVDHGRRALFTCASFLEPQIATYLSLDNYILGIYYRTYKSCQGMENVIYFSSRPAAYVEICNIEGGGMKSILILAALVAVLYAKTFQMETRSSGSLRARLIAANLYQKFLEEEHLRRAQILAKGSQPFIDYADDFYLGNVTLGTPRRVLTCTN